MREKEKARIRRLIKKMGAVISFCLAAAVFGGGFGRQAAIAYAEGEKKAEEPEDAGFKGQLYARSAVLIEDRKSVV